MDEAWHGTTNGYNYHGCRCQPCTAANRDYQRRYREEPRYYVASITGYPAAPQGRLTTSYSVRDRFYNHREVFTRYVELGTVEDRRRADCERECDRLNAIETGGKA